jgi:pyridoxamine 5'-phosphate oxidase
MRRVPYNNLMEATSIPAFYNDLALSLAEAQRLIEPGATERRSEAHCPSVATLDASGLPSQRVMILRHVNWSARKLRFHSDARSTKTLTLSERNAASVLFYLPEAKIQLRLTGTMAMTTTGEEIDRAWDAATLFARRAYMATSAPGTVVEQPVSGLPAFIEGRQPTDEDVAPARENFALLHIQFDTVEWLYLANSGHRRARWRWDGCASCWDGCWLIP